jgi:hypothetical protein
LVAAGVEDDSAGGAAESAQAVEITKRLATNRRSFLMIGTSI